MRRLVPLIVAAGAVLALIVALRPAAQDTGSSTTADLVETIAEPAPTTVPPPTPSPTTRPVAPELAERTVAFRVGDLEMPALATGARIAIYNPPVRLGALTADRPQDALLVSPRTEELVFAYETASREFTSVEWAQPIPADANVIDVVQPWRQPPPPATEPIVLGWQIGEAATVDPGDVDPRVTVVAPIWWRVGLHGHLEGHADAAYVEAAHAGGLEVWPTVQSLDTDNLHTLLSEPPVRAEVAETLIAAIDAAGADGVNIDFEGFLEDNTDDFTAFVQLVTDLAHGEGLVVSYDLVPRTDTWEVSPPELAFWSTAPDRRSLSRIVDYTVLMAYDMFNGYRPAGPVAPPGWVEESLTYLFRYTDPHAVVLGVPLYGRVWDPTSLDSPRAIATGALVDLASTGRAETDPMYQLPLVTLEDGRFMWLEDAATMRERVALVARFGLAGVAGWRLGLDSPELWDAIDPR